MRIRLIFFIELITFLSIYLFNKILIDYSLNLLDLKSKILAKCFPMFTSIISMILICKKIYIPIVYIIMFFIYVITFKAIFYNSIVDIASIIIYQIFHMILFRDISVGILSILSGKSMYESIQCYEIYILSFGLCRFLMYILIVNFNKICDVSMSKKLLINKKNLL